MIPELICSLNNSNMTTGCSCFLLIVKRSNSFPMIEFRQANYRFGYKNDP